MKDTLDWRLVSIVVCLAILILLVLGAVKHWAWAGFDRPLYDWLQLLVTPIVLVLIVVWFKRADKKSQLAITEKRADNERRLAIDNQQEIALQAYFDHIQNLLLHEKLRESKPEDEVRNIARVRTLTMFHQLNTRRINYMLAFLRELGLITKDADSSIIPFTYIDLRHADLHSLALYDLDLRGADLSDSNLSAVNLAGANLNRADLNDSDLSYARLSVSNLSYTDLSGADLSHADLTGANLSHANLNGANLSAANLNAADLTAAILTGATIDQPSLNKSTATQEQLATMNIIS